MHRLLIRTNFTPFLAPTPSLDSSPLHWLSLEGLYIPNATLQPSQLLQGTNTPRLIHRQASIKNILQHPALETHPVTQALQ